MPIPKPEKDEKKNTYISRCIEFLASEDSDMSNKQRVAICYSEWEESKKQKKKGHILFLKEPKKDKLTPFFGGNASIAGQYEEVPPLPENNKPKSTLELLEDELKIP